MYKYFDKDQMTNDYTNISEDGDTTHANGNGYDDGTYIQVNHHQQQQQQQQHHIASNPAGVILERPDYFTLPALEDLVSKIDHKGDCWIEDFSIGRVDYGCITFPGLTNVANLNLDEIGKFSIYMCNN